MTVTWLQAWTGMKKHAVKQWQSWWLATKCTHKKQQHKIGVATQWRDGVHVHTEEFHWLPRWKGFRLFSLVCVCLVKRAGGHAQVQALQFPEVESNKSLVPYDVSSTGISRYGKYAQLARTYRVQIARLVLLYSCIKLTTSIPLITSKQKSLVGHHYNLPITSPTSTYVRLLENCSYSL